MTWTKAHSKNAVAAKARKRLAAVEQLGFEEQGGRVRLPRLAADFTINIRARSGGRVQISVTRLGKRFLTAQGVRSARQISRAIEVLLREATP